MFALSTGQSFSLVPLQDYLCIPEGETQLSLHKEAVSRQTPINSKNMYFNITFLRPNSKD